MDASEAIRAVLPHTWHAFFGRFGRLRPVQELVIPSLASGESLLVAAPTAAGKTEAIIAPLLERTFELGPVSSLGLHTLVVSPTRALCNDLLRRLRGPVSGCGLRPAIKTGDASTLDGAEQAHLLITTPESLDSLLCRRPRILREVRAVMLDELHLIDASARGDQLCHLLSRLARVSDYPLQRCGASATLPDAEAIARRYLGLESRCVSTAAAFADGQRGIEVETAQATSVTEAGRIIAEAFGQEARAKLLVFANRRSDVEALVGLLRHQPLLAGRVLAHHGSLAREERLRVERRFLDEPSAICVATTTLEIGIDVAGVDRVVLVGPPPNVSSLLQRVGRSNRAESTARVLCLYRGAFERARFEHLVACARRGDLFGEPVAHRPAVLAQQAMSLLFQNPKRWVSAAAMVDRLPPTLHDRFDRNDCAAILDGLVEQGSLRAVGSNRYVAESSAERAFELGHIHSNINSSAELEVIDETTGRSVGTARLSRQDRRAASSGGHVAIGLGGQRREVTRLAGRQVLVRSEPGQEDAQFVAQQAPRYSFGLAQDLAAHLGLQPNTLVVTRLSEEKWQIAHFLGTLWGRLLGGLLKSRGYSKRIRAGAFFLTLDKLPNEPQMGSTPALRKDLEAVVDRDMSRLARLLQPGPFGHAVPHSLTRRWVCSSVDIDGLAETLSHFELVDGEIPNDRLSF